MNRRLYWLSVLFFVAAAAVLPVDVPIARFCKEGGVPDFFRKLPELAEVFGHGLGVACILLTAYVLDPDQRRRMVRILSSVVGAGLLANLVKLMVGRSRPRVMMVDHVWDSFTGWFPVWTRGGTQVRVSLDVQSFPSGHAIVATSLAIGLSVLYPRGRWLFACFAVLASLQRVQALAHYLSDTLASAAIACLFCGVCFDARLLGRWFDWWEDSVGNRCDFPDESLG